MKTKYPEGQQRAVMLEGGAATRKRKPEERRYAIIKTSAGLLDFLT
jgi:hypothetical protein